MSAVHVRDPLLELDEAGEAGDDLGLTAMIMPFVRVLAGVYSGDECAAQIARIEQLGPTFAPITTGRGFVERPDIRNNDRVIFDDATFAADLFERLAPHLPMQRRGGTPQDRRGDERDPLWTAIGCNERFRGYRYQRGQRFAPHFDGPFVRHDDERSAITVLVYLNEGFDGGATRFLDWDCTVTPMTGSVLLFDHHILHEGAGVLAGTKYALRSDVMYRCAR